MTPGLLKPVRHDDLHEIIHSSLDLQVFTNQDIHLHLDVVVLIMHKIIYCE